MMLTVNFSLDELTFSQTAVRKGLSNTPSPEQLTNLMTLAEKLEEIRALLGVALHISSGFRSPKVNTAIGGSSTSSHMNGEAADFIAPDYGSPLLIAHAIEDADIEFDQLIYEGGSWVHIGIREPMRQQVLTAHFAGGKVSYTNGLS